VDGKYFRTVTKSDNKFTFFDEIVAGHEVFFVVELPGASKEVLSVRKNPSTEVC